MEIKEINQEVGILVVDRVVNASEARVLETFFEQMTKYNYCVVNFNTMSTVTSIFTATLSACYYKHDNDFDEIIIVCNEDSPMRIILDMAWNHLYEVFITDEDALRYIKHLSNKLENFES